MWKESNEAFEKGLAVNEGGGQGKGGGKKILKRRKSGCL